MRTPVHTERARYRSDYGKKCKSPWGLHTLWKVHNPTHQLAECPGAHDRVVVGPYRKHHTVHQQLAGGAVSHSRGSRNPL